ncbi:hypothetical protein SNE40_021581 [Patella caerulea]|uniref:C1q domain-containing protein n=1 Tax=Patella caerulea TaxID=87958 RepID=A0AAN8FZT7_PATCE
MKNNIKIFAIIFLFLAIIITEEVESKDAKKTNNKNKNKSAVETLNYDLETDDDKDDDNYEETTPAAAIKPKATSKAPKKKKTTKAVNTSKNQKVDKSKTNRGPKGEPGPKGEKGEPGDAASDSFPMQAALSAVLTEHFGPAKDTIVPFDLVLLDLGDNYDNTTGVFICTIPGVYVVSLYLMSHPGAKVNARIYINSRPIAALWADDNKSVGFYPSSSIQTVTRLEFGDQVYVMLVDGGYGESWVHANYNAFTLYLLYEDSFMK